MTIEKTYKLTIKDAAYFLTEQEVTALYEQCRQALNISVTNPNWPTYPLPNTYCGNVPFGTIHCTDNSVMDSGTSISTANVPSSKGINFVKGDMTTDNFGFDWNTGINNLNDKTNINWRSYVQKALDKLSAKTNVTTSDGTTIR